MALALYRRYRPDTFDGVIGQDQVTVPLMRALDENKLTHAYLFSGPVSYTHLDVYKRQELTFVRRVGEICFRHAVFSGQMNVNEQASVAIRTAWSIFAILAIGKQQLR